MSARVREVAPPGSLFKSETPKHKARPKREKSPDYLGLIRRCPCLSCDNDPAGEAAHYRASALGKPVTGTGIKPDDRFALPLCPTCHRIQHAVGEPTFWNSLELEPAVIAARLFYCRRDFEAMRKICHYWKERRR
jgi:hypothetical protein